MKRTDHLHIPIPPMTKRPLNSSTICCGDLAKTKNHMQATKEEKIMSQGTRESIIGGQLLDSLVRLLGFGENAGK